MRETFGIRKVGRRSVLNGVKSGWDRERSHSWSEQQPAGSRDSGLPPVRQRRRRSQAPAQEAFVIFLATGDNLHLRALIP